VPQIAPKKQSSFVVAKWSVVLLKTDQTMVRNARE
jgi:hypothetical protein